MSPIAGGKNHRSGMVLSSNRDRLLSAFSRSGKHFRIGPIVTAGSSSCGVNPTSSIYSKIRMAFGFIAAVVFSICGIV